MTSVGTEWRVVVMHGVTVGVNLRMMLIGVRLLVDVRVLLCGRRVAWRGWRRGRWRRAAKGRGVEVSTGVHAEKLFFPVL